MGWHLNIFVLRIIVFIIEMAILAVAIVAARRHKLAGLWILIAALIWTTMFDNAHFVVDQLPYQQKVKCWNLLSHYLFYGNMFLPLCGWCVLAFSRRKTSGQNS